MSTADDASTASGGSKRSISVEKKPISGKRRKVDNSTIVSAPDLSSADPKTDCFPYQCLSVLYRDRRVRLSENRLSASGQSGMGYVSVLAACSATSGFYYYEATIDELGNSSGSTGHIRIGWSTRRTRYDVPIGSDCFSYSMRDIDCAKVVQARRYGYGLKNGCNTESFCDRLKQGDVIGCWVRLPDTESGEENTSGQVFANNLLIDPEDPPLDQIANFCSPVMNDSEQYEPIGSIGFSVNGKPLGVAFRNIVAGEYYPAVSLLGKAKVTFNFGPEFSNTPPLGALGCNELFLKKISLKPKRRPANFIPKSLQQINQ